MPNPLSDVTLNGARTLMDRALDAERGIEISCATHGAAVQLRQRCYSARLATRNQNKKMGLDPISPWDDLVFEIAASPAPDGSWPIRLVKGDYQFTNLPIKEL